MTVESEPKRPAIGRLVAIAKRIAWLFSSPVPKGNDLFEKMISAANMTMDYQKTTEWFRFLHNAFKDIDGLKEEAMKFCEACGACCNHKCVAFDKKKEKEQCMIYGVEPIGQTKYLMLRLKFWKKMPKNIVTRFSDIPTREGLNDVDKLEILKKRARPEICEEVTPIHTMMMEVWSKTESKKRGGTGSFTYNARFGIERPCIRNIRIEAEKRGFAREADGKFVRMKV